MNPPSFDIKDIFVDNGIGYFLGDSPQNPDSLTFSISIYNEPKEPDDNITILDDEVSLTNDKFFSGVQLIEESVQIRVRSYLYETAYAKVKEITSLLDTFGKYYPPTQTYRYENFILTEPPSPRGKDEQQRFIIVVSYIALRFV